MKGKKKIILLFFVLIPIIMAFDLSEYPVLFINNRSINSILIIADNKIDEPAALSIITGLKLSEYYINNSPEHDPKILNFIYELPLKKSSEIKSLYDRNIIIVGGPCANKAAARIMNAKTEWPECAKGFKQDFAKIKLYNNYGKFQLLVAGYEAKDTLAASSVLENFVNYTIIGKDIEVNTYNPKRIVLNKIE